MYFCKKNLIEKYWISDENKARVGDIDSTNTFASAQSGRLIDLPISEKADNLVKTEL